MKREVTLNFKTIKAQTVMLIGVTQTFFLKNEVKYVVYVMFVINFPEKNTD